MSLTVFEISDVNKLELHSPLTNSGGSSNMAGEASRARAVVVNS